MNTIHDLKIRFIPKDDPCEIEFKKIWDQTLDQLEIGESTQARKSLIAACDLVNLHQTDKFDLYLNILDFVCDGVESQQWGVLKKRKFSSDLGKSIQALLTPDETAHECMSCLTKGDLPTATGLRKLIPDNHELAGQIDRIIQTCRLVLEKFRANPALTAQIVNEIHLVGEAESIANLEKIYG